MPVGRAPIKKPGYTVKPAKPTIKPKPKIDPAAGKAITSAYAKSKATSAVNNYASKAKAQKSVKDMYSNAAQKVRMERAGRELSPSRPTKPSMPSDPRIPGKPRIPPRKPPVLPPGVPYPNTKY